MLEILRRATICLVLASIAWITWVVGVAQAQSDPVADPPSRVGRLAYTSGTVSFHDDERRDWTRAVVNTPLTSGDSIWNEPGARSEISVAGSRVRLDAATQLDLLAIDDTQTRLQLAQGRADIRTFAMDTRQPYQIVTPRGTVTLLQRGDYYIEAGSTDGPTRLGVRSGAAQIESLNGQVLAVRPNEIGEIFDDGGMPQLRTIRTAPPPMPPAWAVRDRQLSYDQPPYIHAEMVGYEDLNAYGTWEMDPEYGRVWYPSRVPAGWAPYRTGHWEYVPPWGWTWIDDQPWGFAPYHYGRWAHRRQRWVWIPPAYDARPVYAPALVAFVGGVELAVALGQQSAAPVGWFPLGPREVYVPPYTTNRDYYYRINRSARVRDQMLEERWQRAERREAFDAGQNQRFATVMPAEAFTRAQPVQRAALKVQPQQVATVPVAPTAAPPAPAASLKSATTTTAPAPLSRPADIERPKAPGPAMTARPSEQAPQPDAKPAPPPLRPRTSTAPAEQKGPAATPATPATPAKPPAPPKRDQDPPRAAPAAPATPATPPPRQAAPPPPQTTPAPQAPPPQAPQQRVAPPAPPSQQAAPPPPQRQVTPPPPPQAAPPPPPQRQQAAPPPPPPRQTAPPPAPASQQAQPPPRPAGPSPGPGGRGDDKR